MPMCMQCPRLHRKDHSVATCMTYPPPSNLTMHLVENHGALKPVTVLEHHYTWPVHVAHIELACAMEKVCVCARARVCTRGCKGRGGGMSPQQPKNVCSCAHIRPHLHLTSGKAIPYHCKARKTEARTGPHIAVGELLGAMALGKCTRVVVSACLPTCVHGISWQGRHPA